MRGTVCVPAHFWKIPCVNAQCPLVVLQSASLETSQHGCLMPFLRLSGVQSVYRLELRWVHLVNSGTGITFALLVYWANGAKWRSFGRCAMCERDYKMLKMKKRSTIYQHQSSQQSQLEQVHWFHSEEQRQITTQGLIIDRVMLQN